MDHSCVAPKGVAALTPDVARLVCERLELLRDKRALRLVDQAFRAAVGPCFRKAAVHIDSPTLQHDLLTTFPDIEALEVTCHSVDLVANELQHVLDRAEAASPLLLGQLKALDLTAKLWDAPLMQGLATRCTSLVKLCFNAPFLEASFHGRGPTPAEQRAHLHRHLTTPATTPTLLYPPSWLAIHCLTDLTLNFASGHDNVHQHPQQPLRSIVHPLNPFATASTITQDLARALPYLLALTSLAVYLDDPSGEVFNEQEQYTSVLHAIPQLPQLLADLEISSESQELEGPLQRSHLAPLTTLTRLVLTASEVDTEHLSHLTNLQHLQLTFRVNDATHLYPLTALTSLSCGEDLYWGGHSPNRGCTLTRDLPGAWRTGLVDLELLGFGPMEPAVLGLLTALTQLEINFQEMTPELVWALVEMPRLEVLFVSTTAPRPGWQLKPPPLAERPVFPSLRHVACSGDAMGLANTLACLTQLPAGNPPQLATCIVCMGGWNHPATLLHHWSPCWLHALLLSITPDAPGEWVQRLLFLTLADVDICADTVASIALSGRQWDADRLVLHVAPQLPQVGLLKLVDTASKICPAMQLQGWAMPADNEDDEGEPVDLMYAGVQYHAVQRWMQLGPHHLDGLPGGSLGSFCRTAIIDCGELQGTQFRGLLAAAPRLERLKLVNGGVLHKEDCLLLCQHAALAAVEFVRLTGIVPVAGVVRAVGELVKHGRHGLGVVLLWEPGDYKRVASAASQALGEACGTQLARLRGTWEPPRGVCLAAEVR